MTDVWITAWSPSQLSDVERWLQLAWVTFTGGCIGSFLNVVVYRVPAGLNIVVPGSHCPRCQHSIRWHDNLPVIGWLLLGGRCRDCRQPIAARYPLVEGSVALLFLLLAQREIFASVSVTPLSQLHPPPSSLWQFWGLFFFHALLWCSLLAAALIEYDGHRAPAAVFGPVMLTAAIAPLVWPFLRPVGTQLVGGWGDSARPGGPWDSLLEGLVGGGAGLLLGAALSCRLQRRLPCYALAACGLVIGWQGAAILALITSLTYAVSRWQACPPLMDHWSTQLVFWVAIYLLHWRGLVAELPCLGEDGGLGFWWISWLVSALLACGTRTTGPPR